MVEVEEVAVGGEVVEVEEVVVGGEVVEVEEVEVERRWRSSPPPSLWRRRVVLSLRLKLCPLVQRLNTMSNLSRGHQRVISMERRGRAANPSFDLFFFPFFRN